MHNTYISSTIYSLRSNGSFSFSFNDYPYFLNERFDRNPIRISPPCCCACCSYCILSTQRNQFTSYLCGLRQSTLLQRSAYRKLILGVGDRYYKRNPNYGFDRGCYDFSSNFKERCECNTSRRRRKESLCCMVEEKNDDIYDSERLDEAEVLLSLLSEEVDDDYVGGGGKRSNRMPCRRMEVERKGSLSGQERNRSSLEKVRVERREKYGSRCDSRKKNNDGLRLVESNSKADLVRVESKNESLASREKNVSSSKRTQVETCGRYGCNDDNEKKTKAGLKWGESNSNAEFELVRVESSKEDSRSNEQRRPLTRSGGLRERNLSSSCSSYYSFSSADFDGEIDVHKKHEQLIEESLTGYKDSKVTGRGRFDGQLEEYKNHRDDLEVHGEASEQRKTTAMAHKDIVELHGEVSEQRNTTAGVCLDWDLRKKSEKKLNDVSNEEIQSARGSSQMHTRVLQSHDDNQGKTSISYKNFNVEKDKPTSSTNLNKSVNKQHSQKGNKVEKTVNVVGETRGQHLNTQHFRKMSEVQDFVTERTPFRQSHSDTAMTDRQENINVVDLDHQTGQYIIGEPNLRSQESTHISEIGDRCAENISIMQSKMSRKNHVQNKNLVSVSSPESTKPHPQKVQNSPQKFLSITGSSDVTDISLVHATDAKRYNYCQDTISAGKTFLQATESTQSNERLNKLSPRNEDEKSRRVSRFVGRELEEASASPASSGMVTLSNVKDINVHEEAGRRSEAWLVPPPSQVVARSSLHVESVGEITSQEVSNTSVESDSRSLNVNSRVPQTSLHHQSDIRNGRGETHEEYSYLITPEDTLASADRFQKSSTQFVGEFFEKVRNETTTSEIEKAESMSETNLAFGDKKYSEKTSDQYASENLQRKEHHKRPSSGGSGAKGPSDEMWDVTDPSILRTHGEEEIEAPTDSGKTIGRKTGRSLWSIVADIARLRWGSRPETPSSAARLGERASPNESFSSEAYSSAREIEENKNTLARDKSLQLATESDKLQQRKLSSRSQGQGSDKVRSTNERERETETETLSSTSIGESGSASKGISLSSGDETLVCNEDVIGFHGTPSGTEIVESEVPPIDRGKRPAIVTEIPKVVKSGVSRSGLGEQMEQSGCTKVNEVSGTEGKDGELKRRKLQRSPQFHQDRFDEWEEAYKLENEQRRIDEMFMREALLEAKKAADYWEVPVGAVLVQNGNIIARGYNLVEELRDSTAHAEMMCIREASNVLRSWRLAGTALYVTLEPCPMCAGAILQARIDTVVWGAPNKLLGADGSWIRLFPDGDERGNISEFSDKPAPPPHPFHPKITIRRGVMASECADTMQQFFQLRRKKKTKQEETTQPSSSTVITSHHQSKFLGRMHDMFHLLFCL